MTVSEASKSHSKKSVVLDVKRRPLLWLSALCLDAPLVAVTWQWMFAHAFHLQVEPGERAALFLTAWWIYLADRFAGAIASDPAADSSVRAQFCGWHRTLWVTLLLLVGLLDAVVAIRSLDQRIFAWGIGLGAVALVYLAINFFFSQVWKRVPVKEVIIGFLFAAGTLMTFLAQGEAINPGFRLTAFLYGCLCTLNCLSIAVWEKELDRKQGTHSFATTYPKADFYVRIVCLTIALVCFVVFWRAGSGSPVAVCLGLSSLLLFALHFAPADRDERTALADLALLTPAFLFVFERVV